MEYKDILDKLEKAHKIVMELYGSFEYEDDPALAEAVIKVDREFYDALDLANDFVEEN